MSEDKFPLGSLVRIPRKTDLDGTGLSASVSSGPYTYARIAGEGKGLYLLELLSPSATKKQHRNDLHQFTFHYSYAERDDDWRSWSVSKKDLVDAELISEDPTRPIGFEFNLGDRVEIGERGRRGRIVARSKEPTDSDDLYVVELSGVGVHHSQRKEKFPKFEYIPNLNPQDRGYMYGGNQLTLVTEKTKTSPKEDNMATKNAAEKVTPDGEAAKPTLFEKMTDVFEEGAYRGGVTSISKLTRRTLVEVLRDYGAKRSTVRAITEALDTELGIACVSMVIGLVLDNFPQLGDDPRIKMLAKEFQVQAVHGGFNKLAEAVVEKLMPGILAVVSKLPEPPKEKLRIAEEQAAKAKEAAQREAKSIDEREAESKRAVKAA